jgi:hypothetical protein
VINRDRQRQFADPLYRALLAARSFQQNNGCAVTIRNRGGTYSLQVRAQTLVREYQGYQIEVMTYECE